ncbi:MAG: helix-turn-helix transcriptional regulator [Gammaproteobacteria bacterium]|nr:helix-turn-helix transcriptional regulator [Gammaproteobacteria bacterium]
MHSVNATPAARAEARIQQLCCLGLGGRMLMPALLEELHHLIPSYSNVFFWTENDQFSNLYDENPIFPQIVPVYISEFYNRREREVFLSFTQSMRGERGAQGIDDLLKVEKTAFYRHDFYNLIYRPLNYRHFIRLVVRESTRALGRVHLCRADDREFTAQDRRRLAAIAPFIAHALTASGDLDAPLVESPDSGVIIAEPSGHIVNVSAQARQLLWMASGGDADTAYPSGEPRDLRLPEGVCRLCRQLQGVFNEQEFTAPPVWQRRNAWGGFTFRVYWLNNGLPEPASLVGITIRREEPLPLKLLRRMEQLPLSGRQVQVCLLLAAGHSLAAIGERLDVSKHTADYHCREVYARFDVHTRGELIGKLALL